MPRRGEFTAWALALLLGLSLFIVSSSSQLSLFLWVFEGILIFSALSISLGNWMDRRTVLRLSGDEIAYENGLRSVRLRWSEVQNVAVVEGKSGKRVQVQSADSHFTFKTLTVMNMFGQSAQTGFEAGHEILNIVLHSADMKLTKESEGV